MVPVTGLHYVLTELRSVEIDQATGAEHLHAQVPEELRQRVRSLRGTDTVSLISEYIEQALRFRSNPSLLGCATDTVIALSLRSRLGLFEGWGQHEFSVLTHAWRVCIAPLPGGPAPSNPVQALTAVRASSRAA